MPDEVAESQEFKTLSDKAAAILEKMRVDLGECVGDATKMTANHLMEIFQKKYCEILPSLIDTAREELNIQSYPEHIAAMDVIHEYSFEIIEDIELPLEEILKKYKDVHNLATLPKPTTEEPDESFMEVLNRINNDASPTHQEMNATSTGRRKVLMKKAFSYIEGGILKPWAEFRSIGSSNKKSLRYTAFAERRRQRKKADRAAEILEKQPPVDTPTLKGSVRQEVDQTIQPVNRRLQSLEDRLSNSKGSERNNAAFKQTNNCDKSQKGKRNNKKQGTRGKKSQGNNSQKSQGQSDRKGRQGGQSNGGRGGNKNNERGRSKSESHARSTNSQTARRK